MKTLRFLVLCAIGLGPAVLSAYSQGSAFTYQGVLTQAGAVLNGPQDLTFTLHDAAIGGRTVGAPNVANNLAVADGLFAVTLDFGPGAFDGSSRWLQIAVRPGGSATAPTELSPRTPITPTPYAMFAARSSATGLTGQIGAGQIAAGSVGSAAIVSGSIGPAHIAPSASLWDRTGTALSYTSGNVGIGLTQPITSLGYPTGWEGLHSRSPRGDGLQIIQGAGSARLHLRSDQGITNVAQDFVIANEANHVEFGWLGAGLANRLSTMTIATDGNVGVGTRNPATRLDVAGVVKASGYIGDGSGLTGIGAASLSGVLPESRLPAAVALRTGGNSFTGDQIVNAGRVGIGTSNPSTVLHLVGSSDTELSLQSAENNRRWTLQASGGKDGTDLGGTFQIIDRTAIAARLVVTPQGQVGVGTSSPTERLDVGGNIRATGTIAVHNNTGTAKAIMAVDGNGNGKLTCDYIQINGGADIAEPFEVRSESTIEPGMVVAIDADRPGELRLCSRAYDSTVAGIVSGANGIQPGLMLQQNGTAATGHYPVALTGRVWCHADADAGGAIVPGDLLTSAAAPGHAMKAADRSRAFGAILGKAMTPLPKGKGMVLVLVSLQ